MRVFFQSANFQCFLFCCLLAFFFWSSHSMLIAFRSAQLHFNIWRLARLLSFRAITELGIPVFKSCSSSLQSKKNENLIPSPPWWTILDSLAEDCHQNSIFAPLSFSLISSFNPTPQATLPLIPTWSTLVMNLSELLYKCDLASLT